MPDLGDLCRAAVEGARRGEAVEAYAEESRHTEASALRGEIEGLTFAESRGVGVRLIADGRLGYAYAADPSVDEVRAAVERARENAALAEPDEFNLLPAFEPAPPIEGLYREDQADIPTDRKVALALELERRTVSIDPRVTKIDAAQIGDAVSRVAIASTTGVQAEYARTDAWCVAVALAVEGDETQTGFSFAIARGIDELGWEAIADEAVARSVRMLGATKPATAKVPVVLDQFAAMSFLGVLAGALSAEAVLKGRSLFADHGGAAGRLGAVHARRRRHDHHGTGGLAVRRRGRAERADRALHARHAERLPAQHVHGEPHGRGHGLHGQREARRLQVRARRGHLQLLPGGGRAVVRRAAGAGGGRRADPGRHRRPLRREPDQRGVLGGGDRACGSAAARWASRCAR